MKQSQPRGVALVLVLAFLALISVFIVGFFSSATGELSSSSSYAASATTRQLADTAASIVMGQIREATTRLAPDALDATKDFDAWASQPGMIRCFKGGPSASSTTTALYKLYSSDQMVIDGGSVANFRASKDVPGGSDGWIGQPAVFTDLNEPVTIPDPVNPAVTVDRFPVMDPSAFTLMDKGRFDTNASGSVASGKVPGAQILQDGSLLPNRQARMPVRWLYVLKDGSIATALPSASDNGKTASFDSKGVAPTPENPIVGRVAFWTDDDTSKVNINTAGGYVDTEINSEKQAGSYWSVPRVSSLYDRGHVDNVTGEMTPIQGAKIKVGGSAPAGVGLSLALSQPAAGEFQRYPGHPSTTSLGLILGKFNLSTNQVYNLAPRLVPSTKLKDATNVGSNNGRVPSHPDLDSALPGKYDRLYASVDEMLYAPYTDPNDLKRYEVSPAPVPSQRIRQIDGSKPKGLTPVDLDKLRFFLTAHSRAPELNLFGRPRISLWPVWPVFGQSGTYQKLVYQDIKGKGDPVYKSTETYGLDQFRELMNPAERLIAFCSMIGKGLDDKRGKPYIFQRYDAYSSENDWRITRNQELLQILDELTSTSPPGFGNGGLKFSDIRKYGDDSRQVLTEIFDYIRCVNLRDSTNDDPPNWRISNPPQPWGWPRNTYKYAPRGIVVPSVIRNTSLLKNWPQSGTPGWGRFPLISEIAIDFYHAGYRGYEKKWLNAKGGVKEALTHQRFFWDRVHRDDNVVLGRMINCFMILETFNPMQGYSAVDSFDFNTEVKGEPSSSKGVGGMMIIHRIKGLDQFKMTSRSMGGEIVSLQMPSEADNAYYYSSSAMWNGTRSGGYEGFFHTMERGAADADAVGKTSTVTRSIASLFKSGTNGGYYPFQPEVGPDTGPGFKPAEAVMLGDAASQNPKDGPMVLSSGVDPFTGEVKTERNIYGILVRDTDRTFDFFGGKLTLAIAWGRNPDVPINTFEVTFPDGTFPMPTDNYWYSGPTTPNAAGQVYDTGGFAALDEPSGKPTKGQSGWNWAINGTTKEPDLQFFFAKRVQWTGFRYHQDNPREPWASWATYTKSGDPLDGTFWNRRWRQIIQPGDTIRSLVPAVPDLPSGKGLEGGDLRVLALLGPNDLQKDKYFTPHPYYHTVDGRQIVRHAHNLRAGDGQFYVDDGGGNGTNQNSPGPWISTENELEEFCAPPGTGFWPNTLYRQNWRASAGDLVRVDNTNYRYTLKTAADLPPKVKGVARSDGFEADFDSGTGKVTDGPYLNKADEGTFSWKYWDSNAAAYRYTIPYYDDDHVDQTSVGVYYSPNRQISSAIAFGSLLSGRKKHWTTLAFSPNPAGAAHPGTTKDPHDHVLVDLFTMPVVEPYAISEPFSTAGKVNLNYPIVPFSYIKRTTALRAALQSMQVIAIPTEQVGTYKANASNATLNVRFPLNVDKTLTLFDRYFFGTGGNEDHIFRSASQICEQYLYPKNATQDPTEGGMAQYWKTKQLTSDNEREQPYADLYPRITTKSNTFTVYMRVQSLRKRPLIGGTAAARNAFHLQWNEGQDQVLAEYRGYTTIERYLDPQDRRINTSPQGVAPEINPDKQSLEPAYRFRVIESKRFQP